MSPPANGRPALELQTRPAANPGTPCRPTGRKHVRPPPSRAPACVWPFPAFHLVSSLSPPPSYPPEHLHGEEPIPRTPPDPVFYSQAKISSSQSRQNGCRWALNLFPLGGVSTRIRCFSFQHRRRLSSPSSSRTNNRPYDDHRRRYFDLSSSDDGCAVLLALKRPERVSTTSELPPASRVITTAEKRPVLRPLGIGRCSAA